MQILFSHSGETTTKCNSSRKVIISGIKGEAFNGIELLKFSFNEKGLQRFTLSFLFLLSIIRICRTLINKSLLSTPTIFFYISRRPTNLSIVWTRRGRRVCTMPMAWQPDLVNPLMGEIQWPVPDNHTISVTLFKDPRTHELEDKDWTFVVEDVSYSLLVIINITLSDD